MVDDLLNALAILILISGGRAFVLVELSLRMRTHLTNL